MPIAAAPGGPLTASTRTKTFFAGRPNESTTFPPTASWASALALKPGFAGSLAHDPPLGTAVSAPGSLATGSSHFGAPSFPSLPLARDAAVPAGSLSAGFGSAVLHPASASTAAISPAPPRRMTQPSLL